MYKKQWYCKREEKKHIYNYIKVEFPHASENRAPLPRSPFWSPEKK